MSNRELRRDGPAVVALGGGHGLSVVLQAAREYAGTISGGCLEAEVIRKAGGMVREGAVVERTLVGERQVPEQEVRRPERERDEGVRQDPQLLDDG